MVPSRSFRPAMLPRFQPSRWKWIVAPLPRVGRCDPDHSSDPRHSPFKDKWLAVHPKAGRDGDWFWWRWWWWWWWRWWSWEWWWRWWGQSWFVGDVEKGLFLCENLYVEIYVTFCKIDIDTCNLVSPPTLSVHPGYILSNSSMRQIPSSAKTLVVAVGNIIWIHNHMLIFWNQMFALFS